MREHGDNIAGRDEVIERAIKILKEKNDTYLTKDELNEVYDITAKYIKKKLKEEEWAAIRLGELGRAYYPQPYCNKMKHIKKDGGYPEQAKKWDNLYKAIEAAYQDNQPKKNVRKGHKLFHVISPILKKASMRGYKIEDIEEIQNKIE